MDSREYAQWHGRVIFIEDIEGIEEDLAPLGARLVEKIEEQNHVTLEAVEIAKEAARQALGSLGCAQGNMQLQGIINTCWDRQESMLSTPIAVETQQQRARVLSLAIWSSLNEGSLILRPDTLKVDLPVETAAQ